MISFTPTVAFLIATIISGVTSHDSLFCSTRCNDSIGRPVCAVRNGVYRLFPNQCAVRNHKCDTTESYLVVDMAYCAEKICPVACASEVSGFICARSSTGQYRRFRSLCDFMNFACLDSGDWIRVPDYECPILTGGESG